MTGSEKLYSKRKLPSFILAFVLVATSVMIIIPLTAPKVRGQIIHLDSTADEDGVSPYDIDGLVNGIVVWDPTEDHHIFVDYTVDASYTLEIPAMDYTGNPDTSSEITFKIANTKIDVYGTLIIHSDDVFITKTLFWGEDLVDWRGIYFRPLSNGTITDCIIDGAAYGVNLQTALESPFNPHMPMTLLAPGITDTTIRDFVHYGLRLYYVEGYTNIEGCSFVDNRNSGTGLRVEGRDLFGGDFNLTDSTFFSHGNNKTSLRIQSADINVERCLIQGNYQPGNVVYIKDNPGAGSASNIIFNDCQFGDGEADAPLVRIDGATPLFDNCSFDTSHGESSVLAYEVDKDVQVPAQPIIRNPTADGDPGYWDSSFDNSTMNAIGNSSITLQWYMDVYVEDPDGNHVVNAPVWVMDVLDNPVVPPSIITDASGWANGFLVTELVQYSDHVDNFNAFNISAENNSVVGYAIPEVSMNMSQEVTVTIPFSSIPNTLPTVSFVSTPTGVQSGPVTIDYILSDPNPGDDGNMSVDVNFTYDAIGSWMPAHAHATSPPTTGLNNNTLYSFIWDSRNAKDMQGMYDTQVFIKIVPKDKSGGEGTENVSLNFTVDNIIPILTGGPTATPMDTTCLVEWTMNEPTYATVYYGLNVTGGPGDLTDSTSDPALSTWQAVTLTDLEPGRTYSYVIESVDEIGNTYTSSVFSFDTEVHIQLYTGWNLISLPPQMTANDIPTVFASIAGYYDIIQFYDPYDLSGDPWKNYIPGKPFGNDLNTVYPQMGLMIYMTTDAVLIHTTHTVPASPPNPTESIPLIGGWNMVGYPSVINRPVGTALTGVMYDIIQTYNATSGQWESWDGDSGNLEKVEMGRGYWIHVPPGVQFWDVDYI
jgi:hypothetical protein